MGVLLGLSCAYITKTRRYWVSGVQITLLSGSEISGSRETTLKDLHPWYLICLLTWFKSWGLGLQAWNANRMRLLGRGSKSIFYTREGHELFWPEDGLWYFACKIFTRNPSIPVHGPFPKWLCCLWIGLVIRFDKENVMYQKWCPTSKGPCSSSPCGILPWGHHVKEPFLAYGIS